MTDWYQCQKCKYSFPNTFDTNLDEWDFCPKCGKPLILEEIQEEVQ